MAIATYILIQYLQCIIETTELHWASFVVLCSKILMSTNSQYIHYTLNLKLNLQSTEQFNVKYQKRLKLYCKVQQKGFSSSHPPKH